MSVTKTQAWDADELAALRSCCIIADHRYKNLYTASRVAEYMTRTFPGRRNYTRSTIAAKISRLPVIEHG